MVRRRQGTRTDPFPVRGSDQSLHYKSDPDWDPLTDTSSHVPTMSLYFEKGESVRLRDDSLSRQAGVIMPDVSDIRWGDNIPPSVAPIVGLNPFLDPASMDHIVRAVAVGMAAGASSTTPRSGRVVTIVQWVRCMRGIGCMTYRGVLC